MNEELNARARALLEKLHERVDGEFGIWHEYENRHFGTDMEPAGDYALIIESQAIFTELHAALLSSEEARLKAEVFVGNLQTMLAEQSMNRVKEQELIRNLEKKLAAMQVTP